MKVQETWEICENIRVVCDENCWQGDFKSNALTAQKDLNSFTARMLVENICVYLVSNINLHPECDPG